MPRSLSDLLRCRRVLMLQGPMGPFFRRLAGVLKSRDATVHRILFNAGDWLFHSGADAELYRGDLASWAEWLASRLRAFHCDAVVLFGQSRPVHRVAIDVAQQLGVAVFVFEEGYVRPHFVTLEPGGVNARSGLSRDPSFYDQAPQRLPMPQPTRPSFFRLGLYATAYALAMACGRPLFPHPLYHRPLNPLTEAVCWIRSGWRKLWHRVAQRHVLRELTAPNRSKRWFLLALQVHNDAQIREHSPFSGMHEVIEQVMTSFAEHAPPDQQLVIKHHPMDRAYRDYGRFIDQCAGRLALRSRVRYVHDLHLPTLLRHAAGVVTVNSTAGLQALYHGCPVCTLGESFYNLPGLVHQGGLAGFWRAPSPVNRRLLHRFRNTLIERTQVNLSFTGLMPALEAVRHGAATASEPGIRPLSEPAEPFAELLS